MMPNAVSYLNMTINSVGKFKEGGAIANTLNRLELFESRNKEIGETHEAKIQSKVG